ncbi:zinc finger protein 883-like isoform X2 [Daktulosphaira vitifoliae]|uniref:zinc finger protein 883-like isoform X2 n=1 Tax=Daktulosphaira vitifoliae TaxID=58002 RepID=UPI0021AAE1E8|nr:zinc finger protein 883-like isoform X2 [Daktulosphaira vitifoliae]
MNVYKDYAKECPDCNTIFYSATSLLMHFFSHINNDNLKSTIIENNAKSEEKNSNRPLNLSKNDSDFSWKYCLTTYGKDTINVLNSPKVSKTKIEKVKNYECQLCEKKFGWSTDLKRHILTHTGEKPYKCNSCQSAFTRNFLLQKHCTRVHKSISTEESRKLDYHVCAKVAEIKMKMDELDKKKCKENI